MRPEILAPAGSMDALKAAVHAGADAVYLGGNRFGARAYANNFDKTALIEAIEYCHLYGVKVYLTINTLFRNEEIIELGDYLTPFYQVGLDAVIVQDFGVMKYVHDMFPDLAIHASTQMTITTKYAYELLNDFGVTRIVPARELSVEEITQLKSGTVVPEVEVFVQGALCYCYSGQCLMSSMLGGRSGNRGRCAQTCRLPYTLYEQKDKIKTKGDYLLSPKDLCGLEAIPDLIQAGVDSFKIEGRMKRPEYVAACVRAYRRLLDAWYVGEFSDALVEQYKLELSEVFNRGGFTKGYYHQKNGSSMMSVKHPGNIGVVIGTIVSIQKNQITIQLERDVCKGDIFVPEDAQDSISLTNNLTEKKGKRIVLNAPKTQTLYEGQKINRISSFLLMQELESYITEEKKLPLNGVLRLECGTQATLTLFSEDKQYCVVVKGEEVQVATTKPLTEDVVRDKVEKIGNTRYYFSDLKIELIGEVFYPLKGLKDLRRNAIAKLEQTILDADRRTMKNVSNSSVETGESSKEKWKDSGKHIVVVSNEEQYQYIQQQQCFDEVYVDMQWFDRITLENILCIARENRISVMLPPVVRMYYLKEIEDIIIYIQKEKLDVGIVVRNIDELAMLKGLDFSGRIVADSSLYTMNQYAAAFIRKQFPQIRLTIPVELNMHQIKGLDFIERNCEIEVYGYQQLMVSAQCLKNTVGRCNKTGFSFVMKDRYLKNFFVFSICKYCYNLIYNGVPTVLFDLVRQDFGDMLSQRVHFTKETKEEMKAVLAALLGERSLEVEKTRGHYKRGVK